MSEQSSLIIASTQEAIPLAIYFGTISRPVRSVGMSADDAWVTLCSENLFSIALFGASNLSMPAT
ncbi:MAG: hypothetical protein KME42_00475 [Tildeniella nuda ZEHNDER 1965/U140]|jgi:hypothetical protein|nr:hypothetical protein [Tildeniella nuda ZEHNDER 1965/U140]